MSKKSKALNQQKRLQKKRAIKAANKALYASRKLAGLNSKSKRAIKRAGIKLVKIVDHPHGNCGNVGCKKCFKEFNEAA